MKKERVHLALEHVWEITTEHGTRHLIDLRDGMTLRMRLPGEGRPAHPHDESWQSRVGMIHHRDMAETGEFDRHEVVIGEPFKVAGPGFGDWYVSTPVVSARVLEEREIPDLGDHVAHTGDTADEVRAERRRWRVRQQLRGKLLRSRESGNDSLWRIHATAARAETLQRSGYSWEQIDQMIDLGRGEDRRKVWAALERIMNQDEDCVDVARSILDEEDDL